MDQFSVGALCEHEIVIKSLILLSPLPQLPFLVSSCWWFSFFFFLYLSLTVCSVSVTCFLSQETRPCYIPAVWFAASYENLSCSSLLLSESRVQNQAQSHFLTTLLNKPCSLGRRHTISFTMFLLFRTNNAIPCGMFLWTCWILLPAAFERPKTLWCVSNSVSLSWNIVHSTGNKPLH